MSEKERDWQETKRKAVKTAKVLGALGTVAVAAGCSREGEPVPVVEENEGGEPVPVEVQETPVVEQEEIQMSREAFAGSSIGETEPFTLEKTDGLDLGVEKTQMIVDDAKEKGLDTESVSYLSFYKLGETGIKEKVVILSEGNGKEKNFFFVTGREGDKYVPLETSSEVELVELREYSETEDGETNMLGFAVGNSEAIAVIEISEEGTYYTDPYTGMRIGMEEEVASEVVETVTGVPQELRELSERLGEDARVEGRLLTYDNVVIGGMDDEGQIHIREDGETVTIQAEALEVLDGRLVLIDRERTEEMGVNWVEQVWIVHEEIEWGEMVAVPEPQILMPETREDTLIVKEQALDYFMPKLVAAEKKYLDENGWGENDFIAGFTDFTPTGMPFAYRDFYIRNLEKGKDSDYEILVSSWYRVEMEDGRMIDVVGFPLKQQLEIFGVSRGENLVWHFALDGGAMMKWMGTRLEFNGSGYSDEGKAMILSIYDAENFFEYMKRGESAISFKTLVNHSNIEGNEKPASHEITIHRNGWENIVKLMERLEGNVEDYSDLWGREMQYFGSGSGKPDPNPPADFGKLLEMELIPCGDVSVQHVYIDVYLDR